jgi:hypothetical protein
MASRSLLEISTAMEARFEGAALVALRWKLEDPVGDQEGSCDVEGYFPGSVLEYGFCYTHFSIPMMRDRVRPAFLLLLLTWRVLHIHSYFNFSLRIKPTPSATLLPVSTKQSHAKAWLGTITLLCSGPVRGREVLEFRVQRVNLLLHLIFCLTEATRLCSLTTAL